MSVEAASRRPLPKIRATSDVRKVSVGLAEESKAETRMEGHIDRYGRWGDLGLKCPAIEAW